LKASVYIAVWALLLATLIAQVSLAERPIATQATAVAALAWIQALLIALFFQHVLRENRWVKAFYVLALAGALGLIVGMLTSILPMH